MLIHGVSWKDYVILREALDTPGLRMTYFEGVLELMGPSRAHELNKTSIARLVELYAFLQNLPLIGYGSTTFRNEAKEMTITVTRDGVELNSKTFNPEYPTIYPNGESCPGKCLSPAPDDTMRV